MSTDETNKRNPASTATSKGSIAGGIIDTLRPTLAGFNTAALARPPTTPTRASFISRGSTRAQPPRFGGPLRPVTGSSHSQTAKPTLLGGA